jgi:hypothetical protein
LDRCSSGISTREKKIKQTASRWIVGNSRVNLLGEKNLLRTHSRLQLLLLLPVRCCLLIPSPRSWWLQLGGEEIGARKELSPLVCVGACVRAVEQASEGGKRGKKKAATVDRAGLGSCDVSMDIREWTRHRSTWRRARSSLGWPTPRAHPGLFPASSHHYPKFQPVFFLKEFLSVAKVAINARKI